VWDVAPSISPLSKASTSYYPPSILHHCTIGEDGECLVSNNDDLLTIGGDMIRLTGNNFGPYGTVIYGIYGQFVAPVHHYVAKCEVTDVPEYGTNESTGVITCETIPGAGGDLRWKLTVSEQDSPVYEETLMAYGAPVVTSRTIINSTNGLKTTGGDTFWLHGRNFGGNEAMKYGQLSAIQVSFGGPDNRRFPAVD
jgi:hypothetical protein